MRTPLAEYLDALWRARYLVIGLPLLAAVASLVTSLTTPPRYRATATLLVSESKLGDRAVPTPTMVRNFRALVENQSLAAEMLARFKLGGPPANLTPQTFIDHVLSLTEVRASELIQLSITLTDPKLAADVANAMAEQAVARSRSLNQDETVTARDIIKSQLDASREALTVARTALEDYQRTAQVDLLAKEIEEAIKRQAGLDGKLIEIATDRARLAKAEEELARQDPVRDARRALRSTTTRPPDSTGKPVAQLREDVLDPYANPVYENLQQEITSTRTRLAALERERDELLRARNRDGQLNRLAELYRRQARVDELKMQQQLAEKVYVETATRYEQARLQVAGRSAQLQLIDPALPRESKVSPRIALNVSAAFVLVLSIIVIGVVANCALRRLATAER